MTITQSIYLLLYAVVFASMLVGTHPNPLAAYWVVVAAIWTIWYMRERDDHMETLKAIRSFVHKLRKATEEATSDAELEIEVSVEKNNT